MTEDAPYVTDHDDDSNSMISISDISFFFRSVLDRVVSVVSYFVLLSHSLKKKISQ